VRQADLRRHLGRRQFGLRLHKPKDFSVNLVHEQFHLLNDLEF
jgi:hypothetical protein